MAAGRGNVTYANHQSAQKASEVLLSISDTITYLNLSGCAKKSYLPYHRPSSQSGLEPWPAHINAPGLAPTEIEFEFKSIFSLLR